MAAFVKKLAQAWPWAGRWSIHSTCVPLINHCFPIQLRLLLLSPYMNSDLYTSLICHCFPFQLRLVILSQYLHSFALRLFVGVVI
jgi:hypothetical protein